MSIYKYSVGVIIDEKAIIYIVLLQNLDQRQMEWAKCQFMQPGE